MKITLVNGWHDDNKGDGGIVAGTIGLIKHVCPSARLSLVSTLDEHHPGWPTAHRHLLEEFPDLEVFPSVFPRHPARGTRQSFAGSAAWGARMLFAFGGLAMRRATSPAAKAIASADLVVSKGGHFFYSRTSGARDLAHLLKHLYPLIVASRARVPFALVAQSLGPFDSAAGAGMARAILGRAAALWVREEISADVVRRIGIDSRNLDVVPDAAFWLQPHRTARVERLLAEKRRTGGRCWVISVRRWPTTGPAAEVEAQNRRYLTQVEQVIRRSLGTSMTDEIIIVAHALGPLSFEDDRVPSRDLYARVADLHDRVSLIEDDLRPSELAALYGAADLLIGTRFHSVILSFAGGTPAIAISYFGPKADGIMAMMGMRDLCLNIDNFSADDVLERAGRGADREAVRERVAEFRARLTERMRALVRETGACE